MDKKRKMGGIYLSIPFGISIITCLIVEFAVSRQFSWSLLAAASCIFAYIILFSIIFGGKHRILLTYIGICIFLIPYLFVIENIANLYLLKPVNWVTALGIPISVCWLAALGLIVLIRKTLKTNGWMTAGIGVLVFYAAEWFTNEKVDLFVGGGLHSWRLSEHYPMIYIGTAAVLFFVGIIFVLGKRMNKNSVIK